MTIKKELEWNDNKEGIGMDNKEGIRMTIRKELEWE